MNVDNDKKENKIDKIISILNYLPGQLFFTNILLILILFTNLGTENVNVTNSIKLKNDSTLNIPKLYCSMDNILYFQSTYTVVVDDKNKPKKCTDKNSIYVYDEYYKDYIKD